MAISCAYSCMVMHPKLLILFRVKNIINIFVLSFSIPALTSFVIEKLKIYRHFYIFFLNFFSILSLIDYIQGLLINFNFLIINDLISTLILTLNPYKLPNINFAFLFFLITNFNVFFISLYYRCKKLLRFGCYANYTANTRIKILYDIFILYDFNIHNIFFTYAIQTLDFYSIDQDYRNVQRIL